MENLELMTIVKMDDGRIFRPSPTRLLFTTERASGWQDELRYQALQHVSHIIREIEHSQKAAA